MPQEDSFTSQAADCKSETQLETRPATNIHKKAHPDLELNLYVLEIHEHLFFKKWALNGCFLKKKKKKNPKQQQQQ